MLRSIIKYLPALITSFVWGSTFVASKKVLDAGVSPIALMTMRFGLAYLLLLLFSRDRMRFEWNVLEFKLFLIGVCGGSVYFLLEYLALQRTSAVNVGLICAMVPVISTAIELFISRRRPKLTYIIGSLLAFFGVLLLVTDGKLLIHIFPIGDILAICSSILWATYTVVLSRVGKGVKEVVVERRMMFYSFITIIPFAVIMLDADDEMVAITSSVDVVLSIVYLSVVASALCLWLWNVSINNIGVVSTNNFLYLLPVVSLLSSTLLMHGEVNIVTVFSTLLIFIGIVVADI